VFIASCKTEKTPDHRARGSGLEAMKTNSPRTLFSAIAGLGLAMFTLAAAVGTGIASEATVGGFSALAIYGVAEIAILAYAPRSVVRRAASIETIPDVLTTTARIRRTHATAAKRAVSRENAGRRTHARTAAAA
jgi:hypothetical protein